MRDSYSQKGAKKFRGGRAGKIWALFLNELLSLHNKMTILQLHSIAAVSSYFATDWDLIIGTGGIIFFPPLAFSHVDGFMLLI